MIDHISIKDFAIIKNTEIDFEEGLNVITGETVSGATELNIREKKFAIFEKVDS